MPLHPTASALPSLYQGRMPHLDHAPRRPTQAPPYIGPSRDHTHPRALAPHGLVYAIANRVLNHLYIVRDILAARRLNMSDEHGQVEPLGAPIAARECCARASTAPPLACSALQCCIHFCVRWKYTYITLCGQQRTCSHNLSTVQARARTWRRA